MKKLFFAALLLLTGLAVGCNDDKDTPSPDDRPQPTTFALTLGEPTETSVSVEVAPSNDTAPYHFGVVSKWELKVHHEDDIEVYVQNVVAEAVKECGSVQDALERLTTRGKQSREFTDLAPETQYLAYAVGLDPDGKANTKIEAKDFATAGPSIDEVTFQITLGQPAPTSIRMEVVPSDNSARYHFDVLAKAVLKEHHEDDLNVYMRNMIQEAVKNFGSVDEALKRLTDYGPQNYEFTGLSSETEYWAFAVGLDSSGAVDTEIEVKEFTTTQLPSDEVTFHVEFSNVAFDGFDYTITPSDLDFPYYACLRAAFPYQGFSDAELLETILMEDSFMLDYYAAPGVQSLENEGVCCTDTEYLLLIFGYANGAPTTGIQKFSQRTAPAAAAPADCTFTVTPSNLTSRGVEITVTPSDETAMYMFDLIEAADYEAVRADMTGYVTAYVADGMQYDPTYIDYERTRGEGWYPYSGLTPGGTYYVWVACIDEFGKPQAAVYVSEPITLLAPVASDAAVTAAVDKYFNGDDLYALDPEKYAECRGMAYVQVTFSPNEQAKIWYGTLVREDPLDPTAAIPDQEIITNLIGGAGVWCPTGKLYLCEWNAEHTILAVGVDADQNPGQLLRQSHTFTQANAAPISEFVDPATRSLKPSARNINPAAQGLKPATRSINPATRSINAKRSDAKPATASAKRYKTQPEKR